MHDLSFFTVRFWLFFKCHVITFLSKTSWVLHTYIVSCREEFFPKVLYRRYSICSWRPQSDPKKIQLIFNFFLNVLFRKNVTHVQSSSNIWRCERWTLRFLHYRWKLIDYTHYGWCRRKVITSTRISRAADPQSPFRHCSDTNLN